MKSHRLNILPEQPEQSKDCSDNVVGVGRFPPWLHRKLPRGEQLWQTGDVLNKHRMPTVCEEAKCPNRFECWSAKTATFLAMGKACTRNCGFCDIDFTKQPKALEVDEPERLAQAVRELDLKHVVITMVARDDLFDGGATHLAAIIGAVRKECPHVTIEVLTSDFAGNEVALDTVIEAAPQIFNHNLETVRALTPRVRHKATYERTLQVLGYVKRHAPGIFIKSGLMVGLGETKEQVHEALDDLKTAGCDIVTMGQYLQASHRKLLVKAFVTPAQFKQYEEYGGAIGIPHMYCGPFVRSSYNAAQLFSQLSGRIQ